MNFYRNFSTPTYQMLPVSMTVVAACTTAVSILNDERVLIGVESISSVIYGMFDGLTSMSKRLSEPWSHV